LNEDDNKLIIGAVTFAPFIIEDDELVVYILLLKVKKNEQGKGSGAALFDIMKKFTSKCQLFAEYSKVQLLLSASTALKPHGFFLKQGCEFVVDIDLLELTQKDSTLMRLKVDDKKCGDLFINERVNNL
jgi:predicted N-acetyltransferase YhbS